MVHVLSSRVMLCACDMFLDGTLLALQHSNVEGPSESELLTGLARNSGFARSILNIMSVCKRLNKYKRSVICHFCA